MQFQFTHPGKGATSNEIVTQKQRQRFNSRTLGRVRLVRWRRRSPPLPRFNSRTLGRVRPQARGYAPHASRFNSRTLGRVRQADIASTEAGTEFQFTHPGKGATVGSCSVLWTNREFQFTHPGKGATGVEKRIIQYLNSFNSRTLGRVRRPHTSADAVRHIGFNSRTLGRVRQCGAKLRIIGRINKRNLRLGVLS